MKTVEDLAERVERLTKAMAELVQETTLAPLVQALQAFRGMAMVTAVTIAAEVDDLKRFQTPQQFMSYVGLVPSEDSTGKRRGRGRLPVAATAICAGRGRGGLALPASAGDEQGAAAAQPRRCRRRAADRLEGAETLERTHVSPDPGRQMHPQDGGCLARELTGFIWAVGQEENLLEAKSK